jgi:hypothetical protein
MSTSAHRIDPRDDVAVALRAIEAGERVDLAGVTVTAGEAIPAGHKLDAGGLLDGRDPEEAAEALMDGQAAKNEINEERETAIWKDGVTL